VKLIVGLGNPGKEYAKSRHNIGFLFADYFAAKHGLKFKKAGKAESVTGEISGEKFILLKPQTFMNLSGQAVQPVTAYKKIEVNSILVVHDDVDLPEFDLRIKSGGGDGGHNGLKSITEQLGNNYYIRIRFGTGRPPNPAMDTADWVLSALPANAFDILDKKFETADKFITTWITEGYDKAASKFKDE
jgi:PTH1 family peptidyl-tRNA hydrolase